MPMNRREFLAASVVSAAMLQQGVSAFATPAGNLQVAIDAAKSGEPITPLIFGGYMEPATTRVWAEMLADRKFANPITNAAPAPANSFFRRFAGEPFKPVGPDGTVEMDSVRPFVGKHSPRVKVDGSAPRGMQQSKLRVGRGKNYANHSRLLPKPSGPQLEHWGRRQDKFVQHLACKMIPVSG